MKAHLFSAVILLVASISSTYAQLYVSEADGNKVVTLNSTTFATTGTISSGIHDPSALYVYGNYIYVDNNARGSGNGDTTPSAISVYSTSGALVDSSLVSTSGSRSLIVVGNSLYVDSGSGVAEYTINPNNPISASLVSGFSVTGLNNAQGMAYYDGNLYVVNGSGSNTVSGYNATNGNLIKSNFISTGASNPQGIAIDAAGDLFVVNNNLSSAGSIGKYNALTGAAINASFDTVAAGNWPTDIVTTGNDLYLTDYTSDKVTEYSSVIANDLLATSSSLGSSPFGIAIDVPATPEPRSFALGCIVLGLMAHLAYRAKLTGVA